jgi:hypothetical protein
MFPRSHGGKEKGSILCTRRFLPALSGYILVFGYESGYYSHMHIFIVNILSNFIIRYYMHTTVNITSAN